MFWSLKNLCDFYRLQGKLYVYRPVKSKKELLAEWVINSALKSGELKHGQAVAEITAGNFGIALAEQCRKTGSKLFVIPIGIFSKKTEEKLKSLPSELKEVSGLVKTDCIYRQRYETGETITDLTEVYVMCEKEKSIYSVFTKKDNLLISDMRMDFNIVTGNLERKFYGVIDYLDDWNSDELVLVVNILKEEI